ncbi:hypothetical protein [Deinococcus sp.]|nr:hypothetical protein [Deinococcus sp.]
MTLAFRAACLERYGISAPDDFGQAIKTRAAQECPDLAAWLSERGV